MQTGFTIKIISTCRTVFDHLWPFITFISCWILFINIFHDNFGGIFNFLKLIKLSVNCLFILSALRSSGLSNWIVKGLKSCWEVKLFFGVTPSWCCRSFKLFLWYLHYYLAPPVSKYLEIKHVNAQPDKIAWFYIFVEPSKDFFLQHRKYQPDLVLARNDLGWSWDVGRCMVPAEWCAWKCWGLHSVIGVWAGRASGERDVVWSGKGSWELFALILSHISSQPV